MDKAGGRHELLLHGGVDGVLTGFGSQQAVALLVAVNNDTRGVGMERVRQGGLQVASDDGSVRTALWRASAGVSQGQCSRGG